MLEPLPNGNNALSINSSLIVLRSLLLAAQLAPTSQTTAVAPSKVLRTAWTTSKEWASMPSGSVQLSTTCPVATMDTGLKTGKALTPTSEPLTNLRPLSLRLTPKASGWWLTSLQTTPLLSVTTSHKSTPWTSLPTITLTVILTGITRVVLRTADLQDSLTLTRITPTFVSTLKTG